MDLEVAEVAPGVDLGSRFQALWPCDVSKR